MLAKIGFVTSAVLLMAVGQVLAQEVDLSKCIAIGGSVERGRCFREVYSMRPGQKKEPAAPKARAFLPESWGETLSENKMTGSNSFYVLSPESVPERALEFPYHDLKAQIVVGCNETAEWSYFVFSTAPNLTDTDIVDDHSEATIFVKWGADERPRPHVVKQDPGSRFLFFDNQSDAISRIAGSSTMLAEFKWYSAGATQFEIDLAGSDSAVAYLRQRCADL